MSQVYTNCNKMKVKAIVRIIVFVFNIIQYLFSRLCFHITIQLYFALVEIKISPMTTCLCITSSYIALSACQYEESHLFCLFLYITLLARKPHSLAFSQLVISCCISPLFSIYNLQSVIQHQNLLSSTTVNLQLIYSDFPLLCKLQCSDINGLFSKQRDSSDFFTGSSVRRS